MRKLAVQFWKDDSAASAAEYAVLLAVITGVMVGAAQLLGTNIETVINTVAGYITVPAA